MFVLRLENADSQEFSQVLVYKRYIPKEVLSINFTRVILLFVAFYCLQRLDVLLQMQNCDLAYCMLRKNINNNRKKMQLCT